MFEVDPTSLDELPRGPGVRIVRAADLEAWQDGYRFLAAARSAAQQIDDTARQAHATEFVRGYAEGRSEGASEASRLICETTLKIDRYLAKLERELAALALTVVRRVLGEMDVGDLVARATSQVLDDFGRAQWLKVTVHPVAVDQVRTAVSRLTAGIVATVTVEADPALNEGACVIASDFAVVDASIETQLQAFAAALSVGESGR
jgi:type III secretion protein L